jgi:hypothetical protein
MSGQLLSIDALSTPNITLGGGLSFSDTFWDQNRVWLVFQNFNGATLFDSTLTTSNIVGPGTLPAGAGFAWSRTGTDVYLNYLNPVPEPASMGGALILLGSWFARRRNKRKNLKA